MPSFAEAEAAAWPWAAGIDPEQAYGAGAPDAGGGGRTQQDAMRAELTLQGTPESLAMWPPLPAHGAADA